jgi:MauM/NapG family ferredoxin protein
MGMRKFLRRAAQMLSLALFLALLWQTVFPLPETLLPVDFYLRLDPLTAAAIPIAERTFMACLLPGLAVIILAILGGRFFCGWICPMGATMDIVRTLVSGIGKKWSIGKKRKIKNFSSSPSPFSTKKTAKTKYLLLTIIILAAAGGINLVFWLGPITLITRFYAVLLHPFITWTSQYFLDFSRPLWESLQLSSMMYAQVSPRFYDTVSFVFVLFLLLMVMEYKIPRFWCRFLCPAGALLALASFRPLWRRRVHACSHCGNCSAACPMKSIAADETATDTRECIACQRCTGVCPVKKTTFSFTGWSPKYKQRHKDMPFLPARRSFLLAGGAGMAWTALHIPCNYSPCLSQKPGFLRASSPIRPPGSLPEADFLARCLRCGACMKVCPTNGLQPVWFSSGIAGMFSPALIPRRGACDPNCNACGHVCPTQAITKLPLAEKQAARIGTAVIYEKDCIAWKDGKRCVICQELCPYGAVILNQEGRIVAVPEISEMHCFGCGYCEQHCPVQPPAIVIKPRNALRIHTTHYQDAAAKAGFSLTVQGKNDVPWLDTAPLKEGELPPGFIAE